MADVRLEGVHKRYGDVHVVKGVDLHVEAGEFVVLVGPSGCGKSTTLRMIAGLEEISEGTLSIGGRVVNDVAPKDRDIGMVFQSYALYPHMSVFENIAFGLRLRKVPDAEVRQRVGEVAASLGLAELLHRKPGQLSGGQRQRVAMGRAIARQPSVFLFDEPLSNLDAALRVQMRAELAALHRRLGTTMVYVTHDQVEAMTLADRIAVLHEGVLQQVGPPTELYARPANRFVAGFIGSPSMNFLPITAIDMGGGSHARGPQGLRVDLRPFDSPFPPLTELTLGVRPQHLRLAEDGALRGEVTAVERMGWEAFVHVDVGDGLTLVARTEGEAARTAALGDRVALSLDEDHVSVFGPHGRALPRRGV